MADANVNEINEAADNGTFLQAAFEVIVSNSKNNDTQNVTGIAVDGNGDPIQAVSGNLYVQTTLTLNEGYSEATLKNTNTVYMKAAPNGLVEGRPGDHTGIYAHNTYDVNKITDGNLVVNFPGKTLGLVTHKGERSDYTELIVGEKYKFAISNFYAVSAYSVGDTFTVNGGLWKLTTSASIPAGAVYAELKKISSFTEGGMYAGDGFVLEIKRKAVVDTTGVTSLVFTNTTVSTWESDETYADFPYRASVALTGVTANSFAQVVFSVADAMSGNYAPVAETYNGGIYLYSKVDDTVTIPTIYVLN